MLFYLYKVASFLMGKHIFCLKYDNKIDCYFVNTILKVKSDLPVSFIPVIRNITWELPHLNSRLIFPLSISDMCLSWNLLISDEICIWSGALLSIKVKNEYNGSQNTYSLISCIINSLSFYFTINLIVKTSLANTLLKIA